MTTLPEQPVEVSTTRTGVPSMPVRIWRFLRELGPTGILGILWAALPPLGSLALFYYVKPISEYLRELGEPRGPALYAAAFIVLAGVGLLPTYAQAIVGGYCFGIAVGLPAALIGFVGAALVGYAIARATAQHRVEAMIEKNAKARAIRQALIGHGFWKTLGIVSLIRLPPNSPFALSNLVMASAGTRLLPFALGTLIGMTPRTALAVVAGAGLSSLTDRPGTPKWVVVTGIVLTILVVLVIGHIASTALKRLQPLPPSPR